MARLCTISEPEPDLFDVKIIGVDALRHFGAAQHVIRSSEADAIQVLLTYLSFDISEC